MAEVQLLPMDLSSLQDNGDSHTASLPRLLTASNDGTVCLWDLSKYCGGRPLELVQADDLHTGKPAVHVILVSSDCTLLF